MESSPSVSQPSVLSHDLHRQRRRDAVEVTQLQPDVIIGELMWRSRTYGNDMSTEFSGRLSEFSKLPSVHQSVRSMMFRAAFSALRKQLICNASITFSMHNGRLQNSHVYCKPGSAQEQDAQSLHLLRPSPQTNLPQAHLSVRHSGSMVELTRPKSGSG